MHAGNVFFPSLEMTVSGSRFAFRLRVNGVSHVRSVFLVGSIPELGMWSDADALPMKLSPDAGLAIANIGFSEFVEYFKLRLIAIDGVNQTIRDIKRTFVFPDNLLSDPRLCSSSHILVDFECVWGTSQARVSVFVPERPLPVASRFDSQHLRGMISSLRSMKDELRAEVLSISSAMEGYIKSHSSQSVELPFNRVIRDLLYEINELKGKVKVIARFRPLIEGERDKFGFSMSQNPSYISIDNPGRDFFFDDVFDESYRNEAFFEASKIETVVESAVLIANNVCIFCYGQTNSGKSHTVLGSRGEKGLVELALESIFETMRNHDIEKSIEIEMVEIYRENVFVLIEKFEIYNFSNALEIFHDRIRDRATASTNMNATSSRSHCIVAITLSDESSASTIYIVDLAGSERIKISGAEGDRLAEANSINKSLSTLGQVLNALLDKKNFIPYRDSKLTKLLAPVFTVTEPPSKVIMIANVSPHVHDERETVSTLQFAQRVGDIGLRRESKEALEELHDKENQLEQVMRQQKSDLDLLRNKFS
jgi:hypothetical protein